MEAENSCSSLYEIFKCERNLIIILHTNKHNKDKKLILHPNITKGLGDKYDRFIGGNVNTVHAIYAILLYAFADRAKSKFKIAAPHLGLLLWDKSQNRSKW